MARGKGKGKGDDSVALAVGCCLFCTIICCFAFTKVFIGLYPSGLFWTTGLPEFRRATRWTESQCVVDDLRVVEDQCCDMGFFKRDCNTRWLFEDKKCSCPQEDLYTCYTCVVSSNYAPDPANPQATIVGLHLFPGNRDFVEDDQATVDAYCQGLGLSTDSVAPCWHTNSEFYLAGDGQVAYNVEMSGLGKASMAFGIIAWCCFCFLVIISFLFNTNDSTTSTPSSALYCL